ncbi:hypothetical protein HYC85_010202 [Camellia sinensis]|uniref:Uncharacterized protein n=1 Tax=Camellia sinensis TaxID=4442 RepID=A0A7J7HJW1_CAMSI|nr:hypothetical protein HYC85_010202 [Camellia sinensis]
MAALIPSSSSSSPSLRCRSTKTLCSINNRNGAQIPMPPVNPKDPFLSKLASVAITFPEKLMLAPNCKSGVVGLIVREHVQQSWEDISTIESPLRRPKKPTAPQSTFELRFASVLDIFDSPKLMATLAQVERSVSYNEHQPRRPPPDLPSILLHGRIVYIGMPVCASTIFPITISPLHVNKGSVW